MPVAGSKTALLLVDASSWIYRAFHALPPLTNAAGLPTNAAYGFTQMLLRLLADEEPERVAIVFDSGAPTFRDEAFAGYKAKRAPTPDDLQPQFPWIRRIVEELRLPMLEFEGAEADDVIATLVERFHDQAREIVIVTGDKDMMQVVDDRVRLYDTMRNRRVGPAEVVERFGVGPGQVIEVLALMGDSIDNVPGVRGVGEKTARLLIQRFGSLDALLDRLEEVESLEGLRGARRVRRALEGGAEDARMSRELVRLRRDLPLEVTFDDLRVRTPDFVRLRPLFEELGFQSLLARAGIREAKKTGTTGWIEGVEGLDALVEALRVRQRLALEPVILPRDGSLAGLAFGLDSEEACVVLFRDRRQDVLGRLAPLLEDPSIGKIGGDLKAAWLRLAEDGVGLEGLAFDTGIASYVLRPDRKGHRLDDLAPEILGYGLGGGIADRSETVGELAAERARTALALEAVLAPELREAPVGRVFREIEMPLVPVLARMERVGVRVDAARLGSLSAELEGRLVAVLAEIHELAGTEFNVASTAQLREVLFGRLQISSRGVRRGKTGLSTDVDVLRRLAAEHPIAEKILEYRSLAKLKSTYVDALPALIRPETGRVHTSFNQTVAATGRLSSSDPNLQNIPVRTDEGRRIREAFVPAEGALLLSADYSQIELRILAHLSGDAGLLAAFRNREDVHVRTAAEVFGVAPGEVTAEQRRAAKAINFGIVYGMGPARLARDLGIPMDEASARIRSYFERYPGVQELIDRTLTEARQRGAVTTLFGRRRFIPDLGSRDAGARQFAERTAVNTPIQGTAADLIKVAMIRIDRRLRRDFPASVLVLQVHDELLLEVTEAEAEAVAGMVREEMTGAAELAVPLEVAVATGRSWAEIH